MQQQLKTELSDGCVDFTQDSGEAFFEEAAMGSEALLDEYMDQGSIAEEHLAHAVAKRELFPCYYGSALKVEGVKELLVGFANTTGHRSMKTNFLPVYTRSAEMQKERG